MTHIHLSFSYYLRIIETGYKTINSLIMKLKTLVAASSFLLLAFNANAQKVSNANGVAKDTISLQILDNAKYRVFYSLSFSEDTTFIEQKTECQTVLLIGNKYSSFLDYNQLRKDSIFNSLVKSGQELMSVMAQTLPIARLVRFKPIIIRDYPSKNNFTFQEMITSRSTYRYTDNDIKLKWQLSSEEREIGNYKCKKASCTYRGRNYIAWYSPDIMLSDGPYIFTGLPGLIFELYDDKGHYTFSLNGLEKVEGYNPIYLPADNIVNSTRKDVRKIISNLKANPTSILQMMQSKAKVSEEVLSKVRPKPYNPIELE